MISYNTFWSYLSLSFSPVYHTGDGAGGHLSFVIDATDGPVVCRVKKSEKQRGGAAGANDGGRGGERERIEYDLPASLSMAVNKLWALNPG